VISGVVDPTLPQTATNRRNPIVDLERAGKTPRDKQRRKARSCRSGSSLGAARVRESIPPSGVASSAHED
jgi:hypothetical protein